MAFTYDSLVDAMEVAEAMGVDGSRIKRDHETGLYGWSDEAESSTSTALVTIAHEPEHHDEPASGLEQDAPESDGQADDSQPEVDPADREPEMGDVILQLSGPYLPAMARIEAERLAKKLGMTIIMRDAQTFMEVGRVKRRTKGAKSSGGAGGGLERDEYGLTERQRIALDLMLRDTGATMCELKEGGASEAKSLSVQYAMDTITLASKGRFIAADPVARVERNEKGKVRSALGYRMAEVPEADRKATEERVRAAMVAKGQLKPKGAANDDATQAQAAD